MKKIICVVMALAIVSTAVFAKSEKKQKKSKKAKTEAPFVITEDSGVFGYYNFEDDEIVDEVLDLSGNENSLYTNALDGSLVVEGKNGNALYFNGQDEYISIDPSFVDGDGFTVAAWINPDGPWSIWARFFDFGDTMKDVFVAADGRQPGTLVFYEQESAASCNCVIPPAGKWVHIAATLGDGKIALYVDGKLSQELPCPVTTEDLAMQNNLNLFIGRSNWAPDPLFKGSMDDLFLATRKLSAKEIKSVYAGVVVPEVAE